jgi:hypothetical protein
MNSKKKRLPKKNNLSINELPVAKKWVKKISKQKNSNSQRKKIKIEFFESTLSK